MRYCIFCGAEIPPDAKFCQMCGREQPEYSAGVGRAEPREEPAIMPERKTFIEKMLANPVKLAIMGGVIFCLIIAALTLGAVFMLH